MKGFIRIGASTENSYGRKEHEWNIAALFLDHVYYCLSSTYVKSVC